MSSNYYPLLSFLLTLCFVLAGYGPKIVSCGLATTNPDLLWPRGIIPYVFAEQDRERQEDFKRQMREFEQHTCLKFWPKTDKDDYFLTIKRGCSSSLGRVKGANLGCYGGCPCKTNLMKIVGFIWEHLREDRDASIEIHYENISPESRDNFIKADPSKFKPMSSFDYKSLTMMDSYFYSMNGKETITRRDGGSLKHPDIISALDIESINLLYHCGHRGAMDHRPSAGMIAQHRPNSTFGLRN